MVQGDLPLGIDAHWLLFSWEERIILTCSSGGVLWLWCGHSRMQIRNYRPWHQYCYSSYLCPGFGFNIEMCWRRWAVDLDDLAEWICPFQDISVDKIKSWLIIWSKLSAIKEVHALHRMWSFYSLKKFGFVGEIHFGSGWIADPAFRDTWICSDEWCTMSSFHRKPGLPKCCLLRNGPGFFSFP